MRARERYLTPNFRWYLITGIVLDALFITLRSDTCIIQSTLNCFYKGDSVEVLSRFEKDGAINQVIIILIGDKIRGVFCLEEEEKTSIKRVKVT